MNISKKTIFLSNNSKSKGVAILTLENRNQNVFGTIKVYSDKLSGDYILGLKCQDKIIKQNVKLDSPAYSFILSDKLNLSDNLGCVILKVDNNNFEPILWGSEKNDNFKSSIISTLRESISKLSTINLKTSPPKSTSISEQNIKYNSPTCQEAKSNALDNRQKSTHSLYKFYPEDNNITLKGINHNRNNQEIELQDFGEAYSPIQHKSLIQHYEQISTQNLQVNKDNVSPENYAQISLDEEVLGCSKCDEIAVATATANLFESSDDEVERTIDNELGNIQVGQHKFYDMISDQLKELFDKYPKEENLSKLIDNSHWVKINTDIDNKYHVVGIIYHNDDIKYICYGVPGSYDKEPPMDIREYSQWLPTDINDPYNKGYWVMYQDADSGENILVN